MITLIQNRKSLQKPPPRAHQTPERKPHKTTHLDQPHISASQLRSYSGCPLAWHLSRTHHPEHVSSALVFGSAFHAAAECFYQQRLEGKNATFQDLMAAYDAKWNERIDTGDGKHPPPVKYSAKAGPTELRQTATRMLEAFLVHATANVGEVIAVEEEFLIQMAPRLPKLKGRIDLIEIRRDPSGDRRLHLVDFKTAAKRMNPEDVDIDPTTVERYVELLSISEPPHIVVIRDASGRMWIADGHNRAAAAVSAGRSDIIADIYEGTRTDARVVGLELNQGALPMTMAERSAMLNELLDNPDIDYSTLELAAMTAMSKTTVDKRKKERSEGDFLSTVSGMKRPKTPEEKLADAVKAIIRQVEKNGSEVIIRALNGVPAHIREDIMNHLTNEA